MLLLGQVVPLVADIAGNPDRPRLPASARWSAPVNRPTCCPTADAMAALLARSGLQVRKASRYVAPTEVEGLLARWASPEMDRVFALFRTAIEGQPPGVRERREPPAFNSSTRSPFTSA